VGSEIQQQPARPSRAPVKKRGPIRRALSKLLEVAKEKDPPHKVALGLGLGFFIGFLPIMGFQMAAVTVIALPLRANLKAANAAVWITNPITFIPIYYVNYLLGLKCLPGREVSWEEFGRIMSRSAEWSCETVKESLGNLVVLGSDIMAPLWLGSAIVAVVLGVATYFVSYYFVVGYRARRKERMATLRTKAKARRTERRRAESSAEPGE